MMSANGQPQMGFEYESLPAIPCLMDWWLDDAVGNDDLLLREATKAYLLDLMDAVDEDGSHTFEQYAPTIAGFVDCYLRTIKGMVKL